jgi:sterol desaturase/sphingolipid hydroxylase (fatty acid hydroxylase superfamily)
MFSIPDSYHLGLSLITFASILTITILSRKLGKLIPVFGRTAKLNKDAYDKKMQRKVYADNQKLNRKWGFVDMLVIFLLIIPFCVTAESQPLWKMALDMFVILMFYDFFYYLTHRFLFHNGGFGNGPLMWVHAVHHQQNNPCRGDSSYIHPIEVAIGLGLYAGSILVLSLLMGQFHVVTIVITWVIFSEVNNHNHDLWEEDRFPYKYLSYMSKMHHHHHSRFTSGNFATISLFYDWLFNSYDTGNGWGKFKREPRAEKPAA